MSKWVTIAGRITESMKNEAMGISNANASTTVRIALQCLIEHTHKLCDGYQRYNEMYKQYTKLYGQKNREHVINERIIEREPILVPDSMYQQYKTHDGGGMGMNTEGIGVPLDQRGKEPSYTAPEQQIEHNPYRGGYGSVVGMCLGYVGIIALIVYLRSKSSFVYKSAGKRWLSKD